jgi:hypothetical protein
VWGELAHAISRFCTKLEGQNRPALELAAATYVMRGVHDKLFLFLCSEHEAGDAVLARLMDRLAPALTQVAKEARPTVSRFDTTHLMFWLLSWVRRGRRHRRLKPEDAASTDPRRGH